MTEEEKNKTDDQPLDDLLSRGASPLPIGKRNAYTCVKNGVSKEGNRARAPEKKNPNETRKGG